MILRVYACVCVSAHACVNVCVFMYVWYVHTVIFWPPILSKHCAVDLLIASRYIFILVQGDNANISLTVIFYCAYYVHEYLEVY